MANNSILLKANDSSSRMPILTSYWISTGKQLFSGALAGCIEVMITYPTEYVKIMLQLEDGKGEQRRFRNSYDVIRQTFRTHGVLGVYRGFSVVFVGTAPKYMFRFGAYEQIKRFLVDSSGQLKPRDKLICGTGAGVAEALFAVVPIETIKVKFINDRISDTPRYRGFFHGVSEIVREKGLRGTYQGVTPTVLKSATNQAIRFFVFESLQDWYNGKNPENRKKPLNKALIPVFGAIAGAASVFGNTPLDVVKTRMQGIEAEKFRSTLDCIKQIYKNEGVFAFYKGVIPRLTKVTLEVAIAFTMYSTIMDLLKS